LWDPLCGLVDLPCCTGMPAQVCMLVCTVFEVLCVCRVASFHKQLFDALQEACVCKADCHH
jgi:hypothetical protein